MKTIYYNGKIYTGEMPLSSAMVVENGYFLAAGNLDEVRSVADAETRWVDLKGHFVCSGFNDSHMHLLNFGRVLREGRLAEHTGSLSSLLAYFREFAETSGGDGWVMGRGWNQDYFSDVERMPNRKDLDQVSRERPVCAVRACGHCLVVNSKALEILGITEDTVSPEGGTIGQEDGVPDGRFFDNAMNLIYDALPVPEKENVKDMIRVACRELNRYGITSCQTDDYCTFHGLGWRRIQEAYRELEKAGELTVRVYEQSQFMTCEDLREYVEAGNVTGEGSDLFRVGPLKLLGDGALGARTAFLSIPYADDPSTSGFPIFSQKTLEEMVGYAHRSGMQIAVHVIGDACLDLVLDAYEKALREHPRADHRHGIVHSQIMREDQLERMQKLNLHIYAQSIFLDYDIQIVEARVGHGLASTSYRWKTLMKKGLSVSNGSDCPVELPDVMAGIQCAVTRKTLNGSEAYLPEEAFSLQEALDSYTIRGAESSFEEQKKGRIAPGMLADFVILERNPLEIRKEDLHELKILATFLAGKPVYADSFSHNQMPDER